MTYPAKITTCCYCGQRAAMALGSQVKQELTCDSCGGPVQIVKTVSSKTHRAKESVLKTRAYTVAQGEKRNAKKLEKKKKRKSTFRWLVEEAKDVIEDILD